MIARILILLALVLAAAVVVDVTASIYARITATGRVCHQSGGLTYICRGGGR